MADKERMDAEDEVLDQEIALTEDTTDDALDAKSASKADKKSGKKAKDGEKKPGFFSKLGSLLKRFWKTMKSELNKVTWFSRRQTYTSTLLVLVVMVVAAVVLGVLDFGFSKGLEALANSINIIK